MLNKTAYLLGCMGVALLVTACDSKSREPNIELMREMMVSPAIKAQDQDPHSMKLPPEGTVPQHAKPYQIASFEEASAKLTNPLTNDSTNLARGQKMYMTYCFVCHAANGNGKGPVAEKWVGEIPSLLTPQARNYKDGYYYHIITIGRGLMKSYASQIQPKDRWAIVQYVRHLQEKTPAQGGTSPAN